MSDIIAIVDDSQLTTYVVTGTESTLSDGGLPLLASTTTSNPAVLESLSDIGNVDATSVTNGSVLVFKTTTNKWTSTTTLDAQNMEGGEF